MPLPTDIIQRVREAMVEALDTLPAIVAATGRASGNVVPYKNRDKSDKPLIAFFVVSARKAGGTGDTWRVICQFSAIAEDDDDAKTNELVDLISQNVRAPMLTALAVPLDAYVEDESRRGVPDESFARTDIDITFIVTN